MSCLDIVILCTHCQHLEQFPLLIGWPPGSDEVHLRALGYQDHTRFK